MADALPGARLRPHVKAHKCTDLGGAPAALGHTGLHLRHHQAEMEGMARAGPGDDLLLANEVTDPARGGPVRRDTGSRSPSTRPGRSRPPPGPGCEKCSST